MNIEDFEKLEKEIKEQDFSNSYNRIDKALYALSILGNFGSIFLAYFFLSNLIINSVTSISNPMIVTVISLVILGSLELIKREVFDKFSLEIIRSKFKFKRDVLLLSIFSVIIISFSAYSSLNGAKEFSSKNDILEDEMTTELTVYQDSLNNYYYTRINSIEEKNEKLFSQNIKYDEQISNIPTNYVSERKRVRGEKRINEQQIEKNDSKIEKYKSELNDKISKYERGLITEVVKDQETNTGNSSIFIFISAIIESLILIGIFFNKMYKFRSYTDFKSKIVKDPNYQKWYMYNKIMDSIYPPDSKTGDKVPSVNTLYELSKINSVSISLTELKQCLKLFNSLKMTKSSGPVKTLNKDKEESYKILKTHFKID